MSFLSKALGVIETFAKDATSVAASELTGGPIAAGATAVESIVQSVAGQQLKGTLGDTVLAGEESLLESHEFIGLTPDESALFDTAAEGITRFLLTVASRKFNLSLIAPTPATPIPPTTPVS